MCAVLSNVRDAAITECIAKRAGCADLYRTRYVQHASDARSRTIDTTRA